MNSLTHSLSFHMLLPHIVQPTRIRNNFKTPIDNIYPNMITPSKTLDNLIAKISDHLHKFFVPPDILSNPSSTKFSIFERDWSKFDQENFVLGYISVDWQNLLK